MDFQLVPIKVAELFIVIHSIILQNGDIMVLKIKIQQILHVVEIQLTHYYKNLHLGVKFICSFTVYKHPLSDEFINMLLECLFGPSC